jgi:hypothetical protein
LIDKLKNNGFNVRYIHPNTLFISWLHWVPSYVRTELKKKTGIVVNEYGEKMNEDDQVLNNNSSNMIDENFNLITKDQDNIINNNKSKKTYTSIKSYKPSGNLIYDNDLLNKIEDKFM